MTPLSLSHISGTSRQTDIAALFDVDNTLLPGQASEVRFFRFLWKRGLVGWRELRDSVGWVLRNAPPVSLHPLRERKLYLAGKANGEASPLGRLLADAAAEKGRKPGSYHGYSYRILTTQGPDAPGGARNYIADGRMTGGFGLVAWPTSYGRSGVMTFMINQDGQVYEKNLGPDTATQAARVKAFNPDATWRKVEDNQ